LTLDITDYNDIQAAFVEALSVR